MNALELCNACDAPINTPNPMGYCDECLKAAIEATPCTCGRGEGHHHPDCPKWDSHVDNYDQDEPKVLSLDQLIALRLFASAHGRTWKAKLNAAWMTGNYPTGSVLPALQQIRNNFGPSWLARFSLKSDKRLA